MKLKYKTIIFEAEYTSSKYTFLNKRLTSPYINFLTFVTVSNHCLWIMRVAYEKSAVNLKDTYLYVISLFAHAAFSFLYL